MGPNLNLKAFAQQTINKMRDNKEEAFANDATNKGLISKYKPVPAAP